MARLRIELLGLMRVTLEDGTAVRCGYDKVRALLAYLAVEHDRPQSRAALAELLWPEQPADVGRASLRRALAALRDALGDHDPSRRLVLADRSTAQLSPAAAIAVDALELAGLVAACDAHPHPAGALCDECADRLSRAADIYRGDFLALLSLPDSVAFEEWAAVWRERLHDQAVSALARLALHYEARGEDLSARDAASRWAHLARWDEAAYRCLMRLYARAGQRSAALAQYERCRSLLANELGLGPSAETAALCSAIRDGRLAPSEPSAALAALPLITPPALPAPPNHLIGRERDLSELLDALSEGCQRLITITGPPGVGKTRLGLALAHALAVGQRYRDGVWFVPLGSVADVAMVAPSIVRCLSIPAVRGRPPEANLAAFFSSRRALLLLDNFEQVVEAAPLVGELLAAAPALAVVVTSRARLHLSAEHVYALAPLPVPRCDRWPEVAEYAAVQLFAARARAADRSFALDARNGELAGALCRRLDGLPLAIELAAARAKVNGLADLSAHLARGGIWLLRGGARDLPERQRTLGGVIAWSVDRLGEAARRLLLRASVFAGGFTLDGAAAVAGDLAGGAPVADLLALLVDHSLVQAGRGGDGRTRFALLEVVRAFAAEHLAASGELDDARWRHAVFFLRLAEDLEPGIFDRRHLATLDTLEAERENLLEAAAWCADAGEQGALVAGELAPAAIRLRLAHVLGWLWLLRGSLPEGIRWLRRALAATPEAEAAVRGPALGSLGALEAVDGQLEQAEAHLAQSLELGRACGHGRTIFHALWMLSFVAWCRGDAPAATTLAEQCLSLGPEIGGFQHAVALLQRGRVAAAAGDVERGQVWLAEALSRMRALGAAWWVGGIVLNMGLAAVFDADLRRARACFEESLAQLCEARAPELMASALHNLAEVAQLEGRFDEAAARAGELAQMWRDLGEEAAAAVARVLLAEIELDRGAYGRATDLCDEALAVARRLGDPGVAARALVARGQARLAAGDLVSARASLAEAAQEVQTCGDRETRLKELSLAGLAAAYRGDHAGARAILAERQAIVDGLRRQDERAALLCELGHVERAAGELAAAATHLAAGIAIYRRMAAPVRTAWALERLAWALAGQGDADRAARARGEAAELYRQVGAGPWPIDRQLLQCARLDHELQG